MSMMRLRTPWVCSTCATRSRVLAQCRPIRLGSRALAADVKAEPRELHAGGNHMLYQQFGVARLHSEFRREVRLGRWVSERQPHEQLDVGRSAGEFVYLAKILDDERANTRRIGMVDVGRLLDRMGVNAPLHRQAELLQMIDLRATGDIETTTTDGDRRKHDRMRQCLHGVVQSETRAAWRSAVDTAGRPGAAAALTAGCRDARPRRSSDPHPRAGCHAIAIAATGSLSSSFTRGRRTASIPLNRS